MNKKEAIEEIRRQSKNGAVGFAVLSMDADDIEMYGDEELKAVFAKLGKRAKARLLSILMGECHATLEESLEYGFKRLFESTMRCIDLDGRREEIIEEAKQK